MKKPRAIYRKIASAAFLLLYLFVAAPVQLWHSHHIAQKRVVAVKKDQASIGNQKEDCKICQHTYSGYTVTEVHFTAQLFVFKTIPPQVLAFNYCKPFSSSVSNKGPPPVSFC